MTTRTPVLSLITAYTAAMVALSSGVARAVFSSPLNGGCYIAASNQCRLHIDPITVNVAAGKRLENVQIRLNGITIYDFRTDISNPPPLSGTTYTLSPVGLDFAVVCGKTYHMNALGKDTGDVNLLNMGQTAAFTCPDRKALKGGL